MDRIVLLSGGADSAVLLALSLSEGRRCRALAVRYGQRHGRELASAAALARYYAVDLEEAALPDGLLSGSALTGSGRVPKGLHYADPAQAATVVPNRNGLFLSLAAAVAVRQGAAEVAFAAHAGDAAVYPDCRPDYVEAVDRATRLGCGVGVVAPFLGLTKRGVVRLGKELGVPFGMTWSCYEGGARPCGGCGACVERAESGADD